MNNAGDAGIALVNADAPDAVEAARDVLPQVRYFSVKDPAADYFAGSITYDGGFASFDIYAFARCFAGRRCRSSAASTSPTRCGGGKRAPVGRQREGDRARAVGIPRGRAAV